ncbi:PREDICTED: F-box protein SKIP23-like [Nelumbo nucifera]|uniref:F-box protein SKIP23-like n=2 Tax=Nelumbo nucifera TaxID=4432 RepID=A0A822ZEA0_NELNU|nr:PREDICTED: F-box protein SKIP23-like [Nelumbo nucifera]DAD41745.1 TPA_asm: hypothetical protein HUJ06_016068 [Nelumbo nucifera]
MDRVQWSELPTELLAATAKRLSTRIDILRFRSVCRSWRYSVSPNFLPLQLPFPAIPRDSIRETIGGVFSLYETTVYLLQPADSPHGHGASSKGGWLIKVEEQSPDHKVLLLNPLSRTRIKSSPLATFPAVLNLSDFRFSELGKDYILRYSGYRPLTVSVHEFEELFIRKAILAPSDSNPVSIATSHDYAVAAIYRSGKLGFFKPGDEGWIVLDDEPHRYEDVVHHHGQFIAVDRSGRAVVADQSSFKASLVAHPIVDSGVRKQLVNSLGELFLVDRYLDRGPVVFTKEEEIEWCNTDQGGSDIAARFKVYKLDFSEQKWVEVKSLGDRVFMVGDSHSFSFSSCDFSGYKRNSIYFTHEYLCLYEEENGGLSSYDVGVFNLEDGSVRVLASFPDYSQLF